MTVMQSLMRGKQKRFLNNVISIGQAYLGNWRNWLHLAIDISPDSFQLVVGPLYIDLWFAAGRIK